jgi:hypothetical protein
MTRILFWLAMGAFLCSCTTVAAGSGVLYSLPIEGPTSREEGMDVIRLHEDAGEHCGPAGAKRATYTMRPTVRQKPEMAGKVIEGCYVIQDEHVLMIFADGDQGALPLQAFKDGQLSKSKQARTA